MLDLETYRSLDALGLAQLVRRGEIGPDEPRDCALRMIGEINSSINAVVRLIESTARDDRIATGAPFAGVPFLVKDFGLQVAGEPTGCGSRFYAGVRSDFDSELTRRYRAAGLRIIGKTNTPELALCCATEPIVGGPTRNPHCLTRSTSGSSGGSAATVAAGIVPAAHGTDAAGSIRMPASDCGLFGLMPSRGVVPYGPDGDALEISRAHVLTRSVRDSAAILDASCTSAGGYLRAVTEPADARLRVAFALDSPSGVAVSEKCKSAARLAASLCEQLGHHVEEVAPPVSIEPILGAAPLLRRLRLKLEADARTLGRDLSAESFEKTTWAILEYASTVNDAQYQTALACIDEVARALASFFKRYDVLLTPVLANTPVPLGTFDMNRMSFDEYMTRLYVEHMPFTRQFNFSGGPAMSVPMDVTDDRLPIGVQFAADVGKDALLFALAAQIERARPWRCQPLLAPKRES